MITENSINPINSDCKNKLAINIIESMFPGYCDSENKTCDILKKLQYEAGLTKAESIRYWCKIKKQILQDEL